MFTKTWSRKTSVPLLIVSLVAAAPARAADQIALRADNGKFLHASDDGTLRVDTFLPGDKDLFELVDRGKEQIALKAANGRFVVPDARSHRALRLGGAISAPAERETFQLVPVGVNHFALRAGGASAFAVFNPGGPAPIETVEIYRVRTMPAVQSALTTIVQTIVAAEVTGKKYDKSGSEETKKHIELPAPTLRDPNHKKKVQVLAMTEEYRVEAQLYGPADIRIPAMLYLAEYADKNRGAILVAVDARLPVSGRVHAKIPDLASVSTGYRAAIQITVVAEVGVERSGNDAKFGPYIVRDLRASFLRLDLSNDILEAARRPIKRLINHELGRNEERLRESANRALQKALSAHDVRIPLLGYLALP